MENEPKRKCSRCGEDKPLSMFHRRTDRPIGTASKCKSCKAETAAAYRKENLAECKKRSLQWYAQNKERSIATTRAWQSANRERYLTKQKEWKERQKENANAAGPV